ncbi:S8 family serine peptidase [Tateyamaria omphalii]|uniref:S8 family serine peptidase n=1 Tax=Tateyamaria omphalii TaxID=299262 RepID=UPI001C9A248C|nr:S8 family serine peptidase [Tateyamaria omphalii]MBY5933558.1 S8 family serine peptidase [Tateyamaria omphalii]
MIRLIVFVCLVLAACGPAGPPRATGAGDLPFAVTDERELVVLTAEAPEVLIARAEARGYVLLAQHPLPSLDDILVVFRIPIGTTIPEAIDEIEAAVPGVTAGANHLYSLQSRALAAVDYAGSMIGWPEEGCVARARVGMIDGGVAPDHPGLASGQIIQEAFGGGSDAQAMEHGSRIATLLVGPGRLRGTPLYSANVISQGDTAGVVPILRALDWLAANGVRVVNISMAGPRNKLMNRALSRAAADGMLLVAAVGNEGPSAPPQFPAAFPFVLGVTAVDRDGAIFRNAGRGSHVDLAAPGVDIMVRDGARLRIASGTSMAAPFVTAAIAADKNLTRRSVESVRESLGAAAKDLGPAGRDTVFGAGLLQFSGC